jgi:hypothetical protein
MPDAQGKIRYAVVAGGWISQGAFMPGVDQTSNSVMTALVTGDPIKADELAALYDLKSYGYEQAKSTRSTWPRPTSVIASLPSRRSRPVFMCCWKSPWPAVRRIALRSMPPPNGAMPN